MRLSIILVICFIGASVSADGLRTRRGFFDSLQNKTKNAFEGIKNLFGRHEKDEAVEVNAAPVEENAREKRFVNPLELINSLNDPAKFAQVFVKILGDMMTEQARGKRFINPMDLIKVSNDPAKLLQEVLKVMQGQSGNNPVLAKIFELMNMSNDPAKLFQELFKLLANMQQSRSKRAVNPLDLLNSLSDPNKFALNVFSLVGEMVNKQTGNNPLQLLADMQNPEKAIKGIFKIVSEMTKERPKRDIASNIQEQAQKLYDNIKAALEKLFKKPVAEVKA